MGLEAKPLEMAESNFEELLQTLPIEGVTDEFFEDQDLKCINQITAQRNSPQRVFLGLCRSLCPYAARKVSRLLFVHQSCTSLFVDQKFLDPLLFASCISFVMRSKHLF